MSPAAWPGSELALAACGDARPRGRGRAVPACRRLDLSPGLVAVTLSATSLDWSSRCTEDAGQLESGLGQTVIAAASVADFAAIVPALTVLLHVALEHGRPARAARQFRSAGHCDGVAVTVVARSRPWRLTLTRCRTRPAQIRSARRSCCRGLRGPGRAFRLESILGASCRSRVSLVDQGSVSHPHFRLKLEAIGFGFLIPSLRHSGLAAHVSGLVDHPPPSPGVPVFAVALLVVRDTRCCTPAFRPSLGARRPPAAGHLAASS